MKKFFKKILYFLKKLIEVEETRHEEDNLKVSYLEDIIFFDASFGELVTGGIIALNENENYLNFGLWAEGNDAYNNSRDSLSTLADHVRTLLTEENVDSSGIATFGTGHNSLADSRKVIYDEGSSRIYLANHYVNILHGYFYLEDGQSIKVRSRGEDDFFLIFDQSLGGDYTYGRNMVLSSSDSAVTETINFSSGWHYIEAYWAENNTEDDRYEYSFKNLENENVSGLTFYTKETFNYSNNVSLNEDQFSNAGLLYTSGEDNLALSLGVGDLDSVGKVNLVVEGISDINNFEIIDLRESSKFTTVVKDGKIEIVTNEDSSSSLSSPNLIDLSNYLSNLRYRIVAENTNNFSVSINFLSANNQVIERIDLAEITYTGVNDTPIAIPDNPPSLDEDITLTSTLTASDEDGDILTYSIVDNVDNGTLSLNGAVYTYTPNANYHGDDSFVFLVDDGNGGSSTATISLTIKAVNDAPVFTDPNLELEEDDSLAFNIFDYWNDIDSDNLQVVGVPIANLGSLLEVATGNYQYTPSSNYNGEVSLFFTVKDEATEVAISFTILVTAVNDAPVVQASSLSTNEDTVKSIDISSYISDIDSGNLQISNLTANNGSVRLTGTTITYTPNSNYNGNDIISYIVNDGDGGSTEGSISVVINSVNDRPVAVNDIYTVSRRRNNNSYSFE